ncbi:hypothetical protein CHS0354_031486 [Potamilus streckersoni]|uniref:Cation-dependent mannose-6-phosphate receptor n=1 Tax=Potamilus streckersoni TaxID=2493646 RepID=A0AAE0SHU5_9BIVA|nr:hypothetical protein CHS0354_031486 [Potamilus streckersoni]
MTLCSIICHVCQIRPEVPSPAYYSLGDQNSATFTTDDMGKLTLSYSAVQGGVRRTSYFTLTCDQLRDGDLFVEGEKQQQALYYMELKSTYACPKAGPTVTPTPHHGGGIEIKEGLSIGSLLCIVFFCLLAVYLAGGITIQIFVRKQSGRNIIPNFPFWSNIPGLAKDGVLSIFQRCRGSKSFNVHLYNVHRRISILYNVHHRISISTSSISTTSIIQSPSLQRPSSNVHIYNVHHPTSISTTSIIEYSCPQRPLSNVNHRRPSLQRPSSMSVSTMSIIECPSLQRPSSISVSTMSIIQCTSSMFIFTTSIIECPSQQRPLSNVHHPKSIINVHLYNIHSPTSIIKIHLNIVHHQCPSQQCPSSMYISTTSIINVHLNNVHHQCPSQ